MKLHRFYIPKEKLPEDIAFTKETTFDLSFPELVHQISKVLKLRIGEKLIFFTGEGKEYVSNIVSYKDKETVTLTVDEIHTSHVSFPKETYLFFSLIKKDNVDWILEKGTEVGVSHFIPIISARSEKKDLNSERAQKIIIEATEQCGRDIPPTLHPVTNIEDIFNKFNVSFIVLEKDFPALDVKEIKENSVGILIGPEGGWTPDELALFEKEKATFRSLGPTTLRAETAAIVASSCLLC